MVDSVWFLSVLLTTIYFNGELNEIFISCHYFIVYFAITL